MLQLCHFSTSLSLHLWKQLLLRHMAEGLPQLKEDQDSSWAAPSWGVNVHLPFLSALTVIVLRSSEHWEVCPAVQR